MIFSVLLVTNNNVDVVEEALQSVEGLWDELLVDDAGSTDGTREILRKYNATVITSGNKNLGQRKQGLVMRALGEWILIIDADERVSGELREEIKTLVNKRPGFKKSKSRTPSIKENIVAYRIPYQNYVFGKPVYAGGEQYAKVRLFKKTAGHVTDKPLHEEIEIHGTIGEMHGKIYHHSYRSPGQLFSKFTRYAWIAAGEKVKQKEAFTFSHLFFYGPHMFWARFVNDKGYTDGWQGFVLAFAFAYMEKMTYWFLLWRKLITT